MRILRRGGGYVNGELHTLYSSQDIVRIIKFRRLRHGKDMHREWKDLEPCSRAKEKKRCWRRDNN
uniref:Uncharacterized protein n=1 Tax=Timema poppense TaxID=170557 RepID=A0A7R9H436_TIMPO|nr:unnamed protein product [Timema poppensis]